MAVSGFFTYRDLYGGRPENYHHQNLFRLLPSTTIPTVSISDTTDTSPSTTISFDEFISSTTIQSSINNDNELYKFAQLVPFAYFHWFLIGLAILLMIVLTIIFTCYYRSHCRKNKKSRKEKKQVLPNFYRYRTANRHLNDYNAFEPSAQLCVPSPARPCPPKSVERLNNQLLRQGLDAVGSPQVPRINVSQARSSNTFTNSASDLITQIKSRLSTHSSDPSPKKPRSYETQHANIALDDELKNDSLLINIH